MDLYAAYQTDEKAEIEGVWISLPEGARVRVARWLNEAHTAALNAFKMPFQDQLRAGVQLPDDVSQDINNKAMAKAILVDWDGVKVNGNEEPYTEELGYKALSDLKDFRAIIMQIAMSRESYRQASLDAAAKNSKRRSNMNSGTARGSEASKPSADEKGEASLPS